MKIMNIKIDSIPTILWGEKSSKVMIAIHGNMSSKSDVTTIILAEEITKLGYQVLSFDLPKHGDRKNSITPYKIKECVADLKKILIYTKIHWKSISLMANSIGAYFSLVAYKEEILKQCLFISPVVNMERIIKNIMKCSNISDQQLHKEKEITTTNEQKLYWDCYQYVKNNPIQKWNVPTSILYGKEDMVCEYEYIFYFSEKFHCKVDVSYTSKHYFHTEEDLRIYRNWLKTNIINQ